MTQNKRDCLRFSDADPSSYLLWIKSEILQHTMSATNDAKLLIRKHDKFRQIKLHVITHVNRYIMPCSFNLTRVSEKICVAKCFVIEFSEFDLTISIDTSIVAASTL